MEVKESGRVEYRKMVFVTVRTYLIPSFSLFSGAGVIQRVESILVRNYFCIKNHYSKNNPVTARD